jgi:glutaredoxin-like protein NrdH
MDRRHWAVGAFETASMYLIISLVGHLPVQYRTARMARYFCDYQHKSLGICMEKVEGPIKKYKVRMFTLSTCGWCKKTKRLLGELGIEYEYADIDIVTGQEGEKVMEELKRWNPRQNVPTIVVDDGKEVIIGFQEERIRKVLLG